MLGGLGSFNGLVLGRLRALDRLRVSDDFNILFWDCLNVFNLLPSFWRASSTIRGWIPIFRCIGIGILLIQYSLKANVCLLSGVGGNQERPQ